MGETLLVAGADVFDEYGELIPGGGRREIRGCVVGLQGQSDLDGVGVWDGDASTLEVLAPAGVVVEVGEQVVFRGVEYVVKHVPFDWSPGRRAWNPRHRPRVRFLIERRQA